MAKNFNVSTKTLWSVLCAFALQLHGDCLMTARIFPKQNGNYSFENENNKLQNYEAGKEGIKALERLLGWI